MSAAPSQELLNQAAATLLDPLDTRLHEELHAFYEKEVLPFIRGPY